MPKKMTFKNSSETANDKGTFQEESKMEKNKKVCPSLGLSHGQTSTFQVNNMIITKPQVTEGWQLFLTKKLNLICCSIYIVIKTMVLQTLQTLSYLKLTQSFGKMSLSAAAHFLIYVGTPCSCHIPEKYWVHKFYTRIKFCAFQEKMKQL